MNRRSGHILVVYALLQHPLRSSLDDHLYSFRRHSRFHTSYLNLAVREAPRWMLNERYDAIVFHTSFLSNRWDPATFAAVRARAKPLLEALDAPRIGIPQDEFIHTDALTDFLREAEVRDVFSVSPESEWPLIYAGLDLERVRMHRVLTGYLERSTVERIDAALLNAPPRDIAIGYRAWEAAMWLGRHGRLKVDIARRIDESARARGLDTDISTREEDTIFGDDWYRFLASCQYTIGVEGGSSILDRDGRVRARTEAYREAHPDAAYEEVEAACFPGMDGQLNIRAVSPRHLEACATRTPQILIEGEYIPDLRPDEHYLELRSDFGNLDDVLDRVASGEGRVEMAERAREDVVDSGRYTYESFVRRIEAVIEHRTPAWSSRRAGAIAAAARAHDRLSWSLVKHKIGATRAQRARFALIKRIPEPAMNVARHVKRRVSA